MTNLILLIGAGLFSKSIGNFEAYKYNKLYAYLSSSVSYSVSYALTIASFYLRLGADADDAGGSGPGSYDVRGNVWHLNCCNPENRLGDQGWLIFSAVFGWSNNGSLGQFDTR